MSQTEQPENQAGLGGANGNESNGHADYGAESIKVLEGLEAGDRFKLLLWVMTPKIKKK